MPFYRECWMNSRIHGFLLKKKGKKKIMRNTLTRRLLLVVLALTVYERVLETVAAGKKVGSTESGALARACKLLRDEFSVAIPLHSDEELMALLRGNQE